MRIKDLKPDEDGFLDELHETVVVPLRRLIDIALEELHEETYDPQHPENTRDLFFALPMIEGIVLDLDDFIAGIIGEHPATVAKKKGVRNGREQQK